MKTIKSLLLLALIGLSVISMAQIVAVDHAVALKAQKAQKSSSLNYTSKESKAVHWQVTFEEEIPVWTFGHDVGDKSWNVTDQAGAPTIWEPEPESYYIEYLGDYSETGNEVDGHWAWVDIISDYPSLGGSGQEVCNTWIQFDNINLSAVDNPRLEFFQMFRPLNDVGTFIDISINGGTSWNTIEVNEEVAGNQYAPIQKYLYIGDYVANESNVSIRFRWQTLDATTVVGYAWQIDDLKIVDNAQVDMVLEKGVMNFFSYIDYTNPGYSDYFHYSSHYGQIPQEQFESDMGVMIFNGIIKSDGVDLVTPTFNVKVFDPEMTEVYNESVTAPYAMNINEVDTLDVLVELALGINPMLGEYTVVYNLIADNDEFPEDNIDTTFFNVTENIMGRDLDHMTKHVSTSSWVDGGEDGDIIGTSYTYLYDTEVTRMDVFISDRTTPGTEIVGKVFQYDEAAGQFLAIAASSIFVIEEAMLGTWQSIEFPDPVPIQTNDGMAEVVAAVELYFGGNDNDIYIGADETMVSSKWGTYWSFALTYSDLQVIGNYSGTGLGIRLISGESAPQDYFFESQHTMCDGESYYWQGNYYDESGTYLAEYQTTNGCCDSIYELELTVLPNYEFLETETICDGQTFEWHGNIYNESGTYYANYDTEFGCDSIYELNLTVQPSPQQYSLIQTPSNGIFQTGEFGEISLSLSETNVDYWTTRAGVIYSAAVSGTGSMLSLGDNFVAGTYDVWSQNELGCEVLQGSVTFIEDNGNNQLIANITHGANAMNFPANEVEVTLYKVTTDIEMNEVIAAAQQQMLGNSGYVVFEAIEPGDYYLGSALLNPDNFDVSTHVYYESALMHEDANIISMDADDMLVVSLHHPTFEGIEGSNAAGGVVGEGNTKSDLSPLADMIVVMQDAASEQVLDVAVTNSEGQYNFEVIPDNTNVELYVTSFAHQVWTPFVLETSTDETYEVNFMVNGDEVFPMSIRNPENQILIDASIYPNPSTGMITIESEQLNMISVSSLDGKQMLQKSVSEDRITLDLNDFSSGMYLIKLETENGVRVEKIVLE